jgi:hypothetical protein
MQSYMSAEGAVREAKLDAVRERRGFVGRVVQFLESSDSDVV